MIDALNNIVVVGQGAMGLLWYHHLSQVYKEKNIRLLSSNQQLLDEGEQRCTQYQFTPYQKDHANSYPLTYAKVSDIKQADIILLCLKSFQIANALEKINQDIAPHCNIILAHNGMGTFEEVVKVLSNQQPIFALLTTHGCLREAPLRITHTGLGHSDIGLLSGKVNLSQEKHITSILQHALPEVTFHRDIIEKQWLKLAINCVINPITALNNINNGEVNNDKYTKQINLLLTEIKAISAKANLNFDLVDLKQMVFKVAHATATNCSSMRCDILAGKPTEIDYINGYIHRLGKKYRVATPENSRLWQQVRNFK